MDQQPPHPRCGKAAHGARNAQKWMERGKHQKAGWAADRGQVVKLSEENTTRIDDVMQRLNVATKQLQRVLQSNGETAAMASRCVGKKGSCMHDVKNSD